jgi:hypothetical protein
MPEEVLDSWMFYPWEKITIDVFWTVKGDFDIELFLRKRPKLRYVELMAKPQSRAEEPS